MIEAIQTPISTEELARQLKVLAEPNRLCIVDLLMEGVQCNCELGDALGLPANLISHHLRVLRQAGLVNVEKAPLDARWLYYSLDREVVAALHQSLGAFLDPARIKERAPSCGPRRGGNGSSA